MHGEIDPDICNPLSSGPNDARAGTNGVGNVATPDFSGVTDIGDRFQVIQQYGCSAQEATEWDIIFKSGYTQKGWSVTAPSNEYDIGIFTLDINVNPIDPTNAPLLLLGLPCLDADAGMAGHPGSKAAACHNPWADTCSCLESVGGCGTSYGLRAACPIACNNYKEMDAAFKHPIKSGVCNDPLYTTWFVEGSRRNRRLMALALEKERLMKEDPHFRKLVEEEQATHRRLHAENGRMNGMTAAAKAFVDDDSDLAEEMLSMLKENLKQPEPTAASEKRELGIHKDGRRLMAKARGTGHAGTKADFHSDEERHEYMWNYAFKPDFFDSEEKQAKKAEARRMLEENLIDELEFHEWESGKDSEAYKAAERRILASNTRPLCDCCNDYFSVRDRTVSSDAGDTRPLASGNIPYIMDQCQGFLQIMLLRPECQLDHPEHERITRGTVKPPTLEQRDEWVQENVDEFIENFKDAKIGGMLGEWAGVWGGYTPVASPNGNMDGATYMRKEKIHVDMFNMNMGFTMFHPKLLSYESEEIIKAEMGALVGTFLLMVVFLICAVAFAFSWVPDARRVVVSGLVVVQPIMAALFAFGIGFLPIWNYLSWISIKKVELGSRSSCYNATFYRVLSEKRPTRINVSNGLKLNGGP